MVPDEGHRDEGTRGFAREGRVGPCQRRMPRTGPGTSPARLDLPGLYRKSGPYWYSGGFNLVAIIALIVGIAPCVPGFLSAINVMKVSDIWTEVYRYAWFVSFGLAFVVYLVGMAIRK